MTWYWNLGCWGGEVVITTPPSTDVAVDGICICTGLVVMRRGWDDSLGKSSAFFLLHLMLYHREYHRDSDEIKDKGILGELKIYIFGLHYEPCFLLLLLDLAFPSSSRSTKTEKRIEFQIVREFLGEKNNINQTNTVPENWESS